MLKLFNYLGIRPKYKADKPKKSRWTPKLAPKLARRKLIAVFKSKHIKKNTNCQKIPKQIFLFQNPPLTFTSFYFVPSI